MPVVADRSVSDLDHMFKATMPQASVADPQPEKNRLEAAADMAANELLDPRWRCKCRVRWAKHERFKIYSDSEAKTKRRAFARRFVSMDAGFYLRLSGLN